MSTEEIFSYPRLDELEECGVLLHLLLPLRTLELPCYLQHVLVEVHSEPFRCSCQDEHRQPYLDVHVRGQLDRPRMSGTGLVFDHQVIIVELDGSRSRLDLVVEQLLEIRPGMEGAGIEEDRLVVVHPVVADALEEGFPLGKDGEIVHAVADLVVPGDEFFRPGLCHEGHEFLHEVDLRHHCQELLDFEVDLRLNQHPNSIPFVLATHCQVFLFRLKLPSGLVHFLLEKGHILHFHFYPVDSLLLVGCRLLLRLLQQKRIFVGLINLMLLVGEFHKFLIVRWLHVVGNFFFGLGVG